MNIVSYRLNWFDLNVQNIPDVPDVCILFLIQYITKQAFKLVQKFTKITPLHRISRPENIDTKRYAHLITNNDLFE